MKKIIPWVLVIIWTSIIFTFSSEDLAASRSKSTKVVEVIEKVAAPVVEKANSDVKPGNPENPKTKAEFEFKDLIVRKTAHFTEYLILALLLINALSSSGVKRKKSYIIVLLIAVLFASMDEYNQLFKQGRTGRVTDVLIDSAGATCAIFITMIFRKLTGTTQQVQKLGVNEENKE